MYLSKTKYCLGIRCPKMMWLSLHPPKTEEQHQEADSDQNAPAEVAALARAFFGPHRMIPRGKPDHMAAQTRQLLDQGVGQIAEASFVHDGCFCSVDMLKNLGGGRVELYELKTVVNLEDKHYQDAAFQNYVLTGLGYRVERVSLMYLNKDYIRQGELDLQQLFCFEDVTARVNDMIPAVEQAVSRLKPLLMQQEEPETAACAACFATKDKCQYPWHCYRHLESPNICDLRGRTSAAAKVRLYNDGLRTFREMYGSGRLNASAAFQVDFEVEQKAPHIDRDKIGAFLDKVPAPLYFLDFETYMPPIPPFDNTRPKEQIVFQYSLHYLPAEDGKLEHMEHLALSGTDPRRALAEQLCRDIPRGARTLAFYDSVEKGIVSHLATLYPDLREHLEDIAKGIQDLETPFRERHYYTREMAGSSSIKKVLPALFPKNDELDYKALKDIQNGTAAMDAFLGMCAPLPEDATDEDRAAREAADAETRKNLLAYCELDTLAMVRIWEKLQKSH